MSRYGNRPEDNFYDAISEAFEIGTYNGLSSKDMMRVLLDAIYDMVMLSKEIN